MAAAATLSPTIWSMSACSSPVFGPVSAFERDCAERGMCLFLADASVEGPATPHPVFQFRKQFIGVLNTDRFITLEEWVNQSLPDEPKADLLLQMDIEESEYEVLLATPTALLNRFQIIVAEFHHLDQLFNTTSQGVPSRNCCKLTPAYIFILTTNAARSR